MGRAMTEAEAVSTEQAADAARLEAMIGPEAAPEGIGVGSVEELAAAPAPVDPVESLAGFLTIAAVVAGRFGYERAAGLWAPDACREFSARVVPVLEKYPWGGRVLAFLRDGSGVEEMALMVYAAPLAVATWEAVQADREAMRPKGRQGKPEPEAESAPEQVPEPSAGPDPLRNG